MQRDEWDLEPDGVQRALDAFQPRSGGRVLREAFYGVRRFDDLLRHTGLTSASLSARLRDLVDRGLLERVPYREPGHRERHEYRLTPMGRDLIPAVIALLAWADRWQPGPAGPTVTLTHRDCGAEIEATVRCAEGHAVARPAEIELSPGPGARRHP